MKRVLISQNENNNSSEYLIVNGKFLEDEDNIIKYGRLISKTDGWENIFNNDFLEIRKNKNQLLIKSFYKDKDNIGRAIYYMYLIDNTTDFDVILNHLENDSKLINRILDRQKTEEIINNIKNNKSIKKKIKYIIIILGICFTAYLISKI